jgi:hypothetical protein
MIAKNKAKELTNAFLKTGMMIEQAKQCALICVDEIISWNPTLFWETVKTEIEKL